MILYTTKWKEKLSYGFINFSTVRGAKYIMSNEKSASIILTDWEKIFALQVTVIIRQLLLRSKFFLSGKKLGQHED